MITLPYIKLKDIRLINKGISLVSICCNPNQNTYVKFVNFVQDIDEIGISSSLVNSEVNKLLALIFKDVRINRIVPLGVPSNTPPKQLNLQQIKIPNFLAYILQVSYQIYFPFLNL